MNKRINTKIYRCAYCGDFTTKEGEHIIEKPLQLRLIRLVETYGEEQTERHTEKTVYPPRDDDMRRHEAQMLEREGIGRNH